MKKLVIAAIFIGTAILATNASAAFFDSLDALLGLSEKRVKTYEEIKDKDLVNNFYTLSDDGKTEALTQDLIDDKFSRPRLAGYGISMRRDMFNEANMGMMLQDMRQYSYDSSSDVVAQKYIAFSKSRGNTVKLFKPKLAGIINNIFTQQFSPGPRTAQWYDVDNALIEYGSTGMVISFMTRAHQAMTSIGVNSTQYTTIYFGPEATRILENKVGNQSFQESFIREL